MAWSRKLTRPVRTRDGQAFATLLDAARYITGLTPLYSTQKRWTVAIEKLMDAAEQGGSAEAATKQFETALFVDMKLKLDKPPPRRSKNTILNAVAAGGRNAGKSSALNKNLNESAVVKPVAKMKKPRR